MILFNKILNKKLAFFAIDMLILKFIGKFKGPRIAKTIYEKENQFGGLTFSGFRANYRLIVIKTV